MTTVKLTIAVAESFHRTTSYPEEKTNSWYHSFLTLSDAKRPQNHPLSVIEQLHFLNQQEETHSSLWEEECGTMIPVLKEGATRQWPNGVTQFPILSGEEAAILPRWNHALLMAVRIGQSNVKFGEDYYHDPFAMNCRQGVKAIVEAMDLKFYETFTKSAAGLKANYGLPDLERYCSHADFETSAALTANQQRHAVLKKMLG